MTEFTTWRSLVDGAEIAAIPDSEDLHAHYDATTLTLNDDDSVSTWDDKTDNGFDLTQTTSGDQPTFKTSAINGNPGVEADDGQFMTVASGDWDTLEPPIHLAVAGRFDDQNPSSGYMWGSDSHPSLTEDDGDFRAGGSAPTDMISTFDTNNHIFDVSFVSSEMVFRIDGVQVDTSGASVDDLTELIFGARTASDDNSGIITVGEALFYEGNKSDVSENIESYLSSKWGISLD